MAAQIGLYWLVVNEPPGRYLEGEGLGAEISSPVMLGLTTATTRRTGS